MKKAAQRHKLYFFFADLPEDAFDSDLESPNSDQVDEVTKRIVNSMNAQEVLFVNRDTLQFSNSFKDLLIQKRIDVIDLGPGLKSLTDEGRDPYYWNVTKKRGHWNHDAHQFVAEQLAPKISERIITLKTGY